MGDLGKYHAITLKTGSYLGGAFSVASALTLTDVGIIVGIATAILTFVINWIYKRKENERAERHAQREEERHRMIMESLAHDVKATHDVEEKD